MHYIYEIGINENLPLIYITNNLPIFNSQKEKLITLFEENVDLKLSHLFSLNEYFESLIFMEFIYHINKGYTVPLPLYLSQKILSMFEKDEIIKNIVFTKIEFIEALRKCLSRYIASATIRDDFCTEDLNSDLFELLLKEDLWGKNIEMAKLKESFKFFNNNINFKIKTKHIFNLFEILIGISNRDYLYFDSFEEIKEIKNEDDQDILIISDIKKENEIKKVPEIIPNEEKESKIDKIEINNKDSFVKSIDSFFEINKNYKVIKNRKKFIYEQLEK